VAHEPGPICKSNVAECCSCFQFCNKFCLLHTYIHTWHFISSIPMSHWALDMKHVLKIWQTLTDKHKTKHTYN